MTASTQAVRTPTPDEIELFRSAKPTLAELLQADPWSALRRIPSDKTFLTTEMFFRRWHVATEELESLCSRFDEEVNSPKSLNQLLFLSGLGGSGKSTFLRYLAHRRHEYVFTFVDFNHPATRPSEPGSLHRRLIFELLGVGDSHFTGIVADLNSAGASASAFFESELVTLQSLPPDDRNRRRDVLNQLSFETLLRFYVFGRFRTADASKLNILVFDNLDSIGTDYLSEDVQKTLANLVLYSAELADLAQLSTYSAAIARSFRFVLCLRDVNHAVIDAQLRDNLGGYFRTFEFYPGANLHRLIMLRRLEIATDVYQSVQDEDRRWKEHQERNLGSLALIEAIMTATDNDEYFSNVLAPIYNNNIKQVTVTLLALVERLERDGGLAAGESSEDFLAKVLEGVQRKGLYRFGFRGALMKLLVRENRAFLTQYKTYITAARYPTAYCLHHRVLLVLLSNLAPCRVNYSDGLRLETGFCNLWSVVEELCQIYPIREILLSIGECFEVHRTGWGSLLLVRNKNVMKDVRFDDEVSLLARCGIDVDHALDNQLDLRHTNDTALRRLESIKLRLSPAGFAYLRHVLPHLEFYSMLGSSDEEQDRWQAKGIFSLFQCGLLKLSEGSAEFLFEEYLSEPLGTAANHVDLMVNFFSEVYETRLGLTPERFKLSRLSFKHRGYGSPRHRRGDFHAYSLVTAHIGYIESFRQYCLSLGSAAYAKDRPIGERAEANTRLCNILTNYVELLSMVPDGRAARAAKIFNAKLERVLQSGGSDVTTRVSLDVPERDS